MNREQITAERLYQLRMQASNRKNLDRLRAKIKDTERQIKDTLMSLKDRGIIILKMDNELIRIESEQKASEPRLDIIESINKSMPASARFGHKEDVEFF